VKGRGTWAESARATSRSFGKLVFFFDVRFLFSALSLSFSLFLFQSVHVHLLARARAKSEKRKAKSEKRKADQGFFWALRKGFKVFLSLSLYLKFNRLRKDAKSLSLSLSILISTDTFFLRLS